MARILNGLRVEIVAPNRLNMDNIAKLGESIGIDTELGILVLTPSAVLM